MENVTLMGCACVVVSSLEPEQIERYMWLDPEALTMTDDSGNGFRISVDDGPGRLEGDEAVFSRVKTAEGKATITILLDPDIEDKKKAVLKDLGPALLKLDELEKRLLGRENRLQEMEDRMKALLSVQ